MEESHQHSSHPRISARLKRANGHLNSVIAMIAEGRPCSDIAQQLYAVEKAIANAKRELIFDHIDHCLSEDLNSAALATSSAEYRDIARYL